MKAIVCVKQVPDTQGKVAVKADEAGEETTIELSVAKDDMGKVIGKQGRIAKAIRTVVKSAASKDDKKVIVEILQ